MTEYKAVPSGLELSRRIVECLETSAHRDYGPNERPRAIQRLNDILQGRSERNVDDLLVELDKCEDTRLPAIRGDIGAFLRQKELLTVPCVRHANQRPFKFQYCYVFEKRRLKIIDQMLYDRAVKEGFPADFFRESYFDYVTFYCLPDHVSFCSSELHNCKFAVCRIQGITFRYSRIYDTEFYSSVLNCGDMYEATLAHTHFHDCELSYMVFKNATLKNCNTIDCTMDNVDYAGATLDGCFFGRITAGTIRLDWATITQGGATEEECRQNREAIYKALGVKEAAA